MELEFSYSFADDKINVEIHDSAESEKNIYVVDYMYKNSEDIYQTICHNDRELDKLLKKLVSNKLYDEIKTELSQDNISIK